MTFPYLLFAEFVRVEVEVSTEKADGVERTEECGPTARQLGTVSVPLVLTHQLRQYTYNRNQ